MGEKQEIPAYAGMTLIVFIVNSRLFYGDDNLNS